MIKTVRTPVLEIAYEETGPADGKPVVLMHGFPDDIHAYDDVALPLAEAGYQGHRALSARLRADPVS